MEDNLKISVDELMRNFRGALIAIIPWLERAKIKWKRGESYDDWDSIAETLYTSIVLNSINSEMINTQVADYDFIFV